MITKAKDPIMFLECLNQAVAIMCCKVVKGEIKEELVPRFIKIVLE